MVKGLLQDMRIKKIPAMPDAETYELEYVYWPWGQLISKAADVICSTAPHGSLVLDYMCATGYLLNKVGKSRKDLNLDGCTLEPASHVEFANLNRPALGIDFEDALTYRPARQPGLISATGGIHHLTPGEQMDFVDKVWAELPVGGYFLVGEEIIPPYASELDRKRSVLKLWSSLAEYLIERDPPEEVLEALTDVLNNDLMLRGEYKLDESRLKELLERRFSICQWERIWPSPEENYGDVLVLCQKAED